MSDTQFWRPVYQLFKPDEPLLKQNLHDFYVRREDSPVDSLVNLLAIEDGAAKFLLAGHRGGSKTTELRRLEDRCQVDYTVVWVDTDLALDKFNIGYGYNSQTCPTSEPNRVGRHILTTVIEKRLAKLDAAYKNLFQPDALELLCEKSGGVMRDLIRLSRTAGEVALRRKVNHVNLALAQEAIREDRPDYNAQTIKR